MAIDTFWDVIEAAQAGAAATGEPFDEVLLKQLAERPRQEILEYAERFDELHDAPLGCGRRLISPGAGAPTTVSWTSALL
ncbi:DUF4240 domain-containing protein [Streptomyces ossamyceticus]|nr:DUF4240 domain-containing protein [Streptomyces ossamyceticus]